MFFKPLHKWASDFAKKNSKGEVSGQPIQVIKVNWQVLVYHWVYTETAIRETLNQLKIIRDTAAKNPSLVLYTPSKCGSFGEFSIQH